MNNNSSLGADRSTSAPFNQELPLHEFEILVSSSLSKTLKVKTSDYKINSLDYIDTSDTNWNEVFKKNSCHTPKELITLFREFIKCLLPKIKDSEKSEIMQKLIEECSFWIEDDLVIMEN